MASARPLSEQGWPVRRFSVAARDAFVPAGAAGVAFTAAERAALLGRLNPHPHPIPRLSPNPNPIPTRTSYPYS